MVTFRITDPPWEAAGMPWPSPWPSPVSLSALCRGSIPIALPMRGRKDPRAAAVPAQAMTTTATTTSTVAADATRPLRTPLLPAMAGIVVDAARGSDRSAWLTPAGGGGARILRAGLTTRGAGGHAGLDSAPRTPRGPALT